MIFQCCYGFLEVRASAETYLASARHFDLRYRLMHSFTSQFIGGFVQGASADPRYNGTYLVQKSVELGKPIIYASIK